jgi:nickel transport protein
MLISITGEDKIMKHSKTTLFALMIIFISPALLFAHGVKGTVQEGGLVVTAQYDTGEAMSYARVSIAAPGTELPFQSGRTDRNGCFCFFPDTAGEWKVVVDDEMGHRLEVNVPTNEAMKLKTNPAAGKTEGALSKYEKVLIGIGIIFGGSGFFFWYLGMRGRKKSIKS